MKNRTQFSKVISKDKFQRGGQNDRQDKNNLPPDVDLGGIKEDPTRNFNALEDQD